MSTRTWQTQSSAPTPCDECGGKGTIALLTSSKPCKKCAGTGVVAESYSRARERFIAAKQEETVDWDPGAVHLEPGERPTPMKWFWPQVESAPGSIVPANVPGVAGLVQREERAFNASAPGRPKFQTVAWTAKSLWPGEFKAVEQMRAAGAEYICIGTTASLQGLPPFAGTTQAIGVRDVSFRKFDSSDVLYCIERADGVQAYGWGTMITAQHLRAAAEAYRFSAADFGRPIAIAFGLASGIDVGALAHGHRP